MLSISSPATLLLQNISIVSLLEPSNGILLRSLVRVTNSTSASLSSSDSSTWSTHNNVEIHTENTDRRIVLDTQIDVFLDTETEVTSLTEVSLFQLVLLNLKTSLQDLLSLRTSNGDVNSDLFVSSNTEGSNGESSLGLDRGLTGKLLQDLGCSGQSVTGLTNGDVQDQFLDLQLTHRVLKFGGHL